MTHDLEVSTWDNEYFRFGGLLTMWRKNDSAQGIVGESPLHLSLQCHRDDNPKPENQGVKALELNNNPFHNLEPPEFISWIEN